MKKLVSALICLSLVIPSALAESTPVQLTPDDPAYAWLYEKSMETAGSF